MRVFANQQSKSAHTSTSTTHAACVRWQGLSCVGKACAWHTRSRTRFQAHCMDARALLQASQEHIARTTHVRARICKHNTCMLSHSPAQHTRALTPPVKTTQRAQNARKNNVSTHARIGKHKTRMRAQTRTTQAHTYVARIARTPHTCARVFANEHNKNARTSLKCNTTCMPATARLVARWQGLCLAQHVRARVSPPA